MLKKYLKFNLVFALIFMVMVIAELIQLPVLIYITKPLIVISLLIMLYTITGLKGRFHKRLFKGLLFALAGDVLLMLVPYNPTFFIYGLVSFLICHLFYISAFYLDFLSAPQLDKKGARIAIFLCGIVSICFYLYIRPHLGIMRLPVLAYVFVISFMMMMSAFRNMRVNRASFILILFGAMFFMLSDSILAYGKFVKDFNFSGLAVIVTYMIAQYLITAGGIERKLIKTD